MSRYNYSERRFVFGEFEITKREILTSISIVAVMILLGILISYNIQVHQMNENEIYNKAAKIESTDLFKYGMDTNIGNAFIYGDLQTIDAVTYPELGGEYMYVEKVKEKYTMHERVVQSGKISSVQTYWTWDRVGSEDIRCKEISFCGVIFDSNKIKIPDTNYIDTIKESSHIRYKYYGTGTAFTGTIFTDLRDKTITDNTIFYDGKNIEETIKCLESTNIVIIFWICWISLIIRCVFSFYYMDNEWLE